MNKRVIYLVAFVVLCLIQWWMISSAVISQETILTKGTSIKIRCGQIDPVDPFRGTYILLSPLPATIKIDSMEYKPDQAVWANYEKDSMGYFVLKSIQSIDQSPSHPIYIKVKVQYIYEVDSSFSAGLIYPFNRYYIPEKTAPEIFERFNQALADSTKIPSIQLKVKDGKASIENILIGNESLQ